MTTANLKTRWPHLVHLTIKGSTQVERYRISASARLVDAYGSSLGVGGAGATSIFEVARDGSFASPGILASNRRSQILPTGEGTNGLTTAIYDPDDFATPQVAGNWVPGDDYSSFIRVTEKAVGGGWGLPGPICIIPTHDFMATPSPVFTVAGVAPNLGRVPDFLDAGAMRLRAPAYSSNVIIWNLDAALPLYVSFHRGCPPMVIPPGLGPYFLQNGGAPEFFLASNGGNPAFSMSFTVVNGN